MKVEHLLLSSGVILLQTILTLFYASYMNRINKAICHNRGIVFNVNWQPSTLRTHAKNASLIFTLRKFVTLIAKPLNSLIESRHLVHVCMLVSCQVWWLPVQELCYFYARYKCSISYGIVYYHESQYGDWWQNSTGLGWVKGGKGWMGRDIRRLGRWEDRAYWNWI